MAISLSQYARLGITALAVGAAGVVGAQATASADTVFDNPPPTVLLCQSGLGGSGIEAETHADSTDIAPGDVMFEIDDGAGSGVQVAWVNTGSWRTGAVTLTPQGDDGEPQGTATTGEGTVLAAAFGMHTNAAGEGCLVLPGVNDGITVPGAPAA
ncbi:hypothetical protein [Tomitella gaofuii]|uniref:hypothetical protein n=1 Tax=Tomitella gaofuii TaxID=2760083 RepID=UPI0015FE7C86|nr:hypothetical protein [Tomitella gaofuii]